ncbi:hypothetical protein Hanom_Chr16g01472351 [Helianthus anomalus]
MFVVHTEITNLKARVEELTKSEADFKERYEKAKSHREHVEILHDNYAEVQATIEPLINNLDWLQNYGIAHIANSILNSIELNRAVAALTVASRAAEEGLRKAEENYDNLSLFVMDQVSEALKHDVYVARLKAIFELPETVE